MTHALGDLITELPDLNDCSLSELRMRRDAIVTEAVELVLSQVERPRINLGSSGPPGRAD